jgi:hypothetical protein
MFIWYFGNSLNTRSNSLSPVRAWTIRLMMSHPRPLSNMHVRSQFHWLNLSDLWPCRREQRRPGQRVDGSFHWLRVPLWSSHYLALLRPFNLWKHEASKNNYNYSFRKFNHQPVVVTTSRAVLVILCLNRMWTRQERRPEDRNSRPSCILRNALWRKYRVSSWAVLEEKPKKALLAVNSR